MRNNFKYFVLTQNVKFVLIIFPYIKQNKNIQILGIIIKEVIKEISIKHVMEELNKRIRYIVLEKLKGEDCKRLKKTMKRVVNKLFYKTFNFALLIWKSSFIST